MGEGDKDEDGDEDVDCDSGVTYAPDDVETLYLPNPKQDQFGLGYKPLDRTPVLGGHINLFDPSPLSMKEKKKKVLIKGQVWSLLTKLMMTVETIRFVFLLLVRDCCYL